MTRSKRNRVNRNKVKRKAYRAKNGLMKEAVLEYNPSLTKLVLTSRFFLLGICSILLITLFETSRL